MLQINKKYKIFLIKAKYILILILVRSFGYNKHHEINKNLEFFEI